MPKKLYKILLIIILLFIIAFSFKRYSLFPLDGDMAAIILPDKSYQTVLKDPFGMNVILHDSVYSAPNRFFAHWSMSCYFKHVPFLFQSFFSPIKSVYLSCALAKTLIHFFILFLLVMYITTGRKLWDIDFLLTAVLISPFFQTYGYYAEMGIVDHSITYTFFYALPVVWVLIFFLPFFNEAYRGYDFGFSNLKTVYLLLLTIVISFNGPLNPAVVLIICLCVLLHYAIKNFLKLKEFKLVRRILFAVKKIPVRLLFLFCITILLCIYSLYIGKNNSENSWSALSYSERYSRLFKGVRLIFTEHLGLGLMVSMIVINTIIIKTLQLNEDGKKILKMIRWILIFSIIYILLLPLGGYREYRPNIVRYDTLLPVTLILIIFYGLSSYYIIRNIPGSYKFFYYAIVVAFTVVFIDADARIEKENACERKSLEQISASQDSIVVIDNSCWIMTWGKTTDYLNSDLNTELLLKWRIIDKKKYFYQK